MKEIFFLLFAASIFAITLVELDFKEFVLAHESIMPAVVISIATFEFITLMTILAWSKKTQRPIYEKYPRKGTAPILGNLTGSIIYYLFIFQFLPLIILAQTLGGNWEWLYWALMGLIIIGSAIPVII